MKGLLVLTEIPCRRLVGEGLRSRKGREYSQAAAGLN